MGDRTHLCRAPVFTSNCSDTSLSIFTWHHVSAYNCSIRLTMWHGTPYLRNTAIIAFLLTESYTLDRSMKHMQSSDRCSKDFSTNCLIAQIWSVVPRPSLKPHCASNNCGSIIFFRRSSSIKDNLVLSVEKSHDSCHTSSCHLSCTIGPILHLSSPVAPLHFSTPLLSVPGANP